MSPHVGHDPTRRILRGAGGAVVSVKQDGDGAIVSVGDGVQATVRLDRSGTLALLAALGAIIEQADRCIICDAPFEVGDALAPGPGTFGRAAHRRCRAGAT